MVKETIPFQRDPKRSGCSYSLIVAKGTVFVKHFLLLLDTVALPYRDQVHLLCMQSSYTKVLSAIQERRLERARLQVGGQRSKARKQRVHERQLEGDEERERRKLFHGNRSDFVKVSQEQPRWVDLARASQ